MKFHAGDDGWAELLAAAKANGAQVPIKPAPTPAEQAHEMVPTRRRTRWISPHGNSF